MPPRVGKAKKKITGELRRSQLLTSYGSGALVDFPRFSGIMAGIDRWDINKLTEGEKKHERNLQLLLGVDYFYQVVSDSDNIEDSFSLPAYRFPTWYYCPECHRLDHYKKISRSTSSNKSDYNSELVCNVCSSGKNTVKLIPSRFVVACLNGHIDDFPYVWWVHRGEELCENPKLKLEYKGTTGGLDSIVVYCESCGKSKSMEGCMKQDALKGFKCSRKMPWLGMNENKKPWYVDPEQCNATPRVLQRSANNVYYSVNKSVLTVPPWSKKIQAVLAQKNSIFEDIFDEDDDDIIQVRLKKQFNKNPELYGNDFAAFKLAAYRRYKDEPETVTEESIRCEEYRAFTGLDIDDELFRTESVETPAFLKTYVKQIKLVKKLREVMAIQGFRRILPSMTLTQEEKEEKGINNRDFAPISKQPLNWLPAIELFGEGIFIELDEDAVKAWEQINKARYSNWGFEKDISWIGKGMFDSDAPRFVLLHTLSHLLIRQLTAQCGYATASMKEKIYSTYKDGDTPMCGILIYTSATDTDGSLGGLVREGHTDRIGDTFKKMLEDSSWCSNDPLCIDAKAQGFKGLNRAACHACALLPETSCEAINCLLDRAAVVGTPEDAAIGYFHTLL